MNSWAQLKILDCLCSGCSTKSKDKMMNHREEGDSKKESTRKGCTNQQWTVLQSRLIPSLLPVCWTGGGDTAIPLLKYSFEITFSVLQDRLQCQGTWTFSLLLCLLIHTLWIQGILLPSWSWGWHWGKQDPVQTLPAHLITLTKGGQPWCSLTCNYEAHWAGQALVAACQQWLY